MGLSVGNSIYSANSVRPAIDSQALVRVSEQILNPQNQPTIDVSKLDLSKFNRVQLGTDLYAEKTNAQMALQAAKAVTDFDVKLSNGFSANVQYLNSLAAQNYMGTKDLNGQLTIAVEIAKEVNELEQVLASSQVNETQNTNKDKKGQNPFSFYVPVENENHKDDAELSDYSSINIFA
ncbi:hypothetical protein IJD44_06655 [bacterium]|nr:hypothetical protein [bacterium]